ncbi:uncharacterized protein LOC106713191 [Papilio machaon]|uniref:uncharacterized protein LOC106713191 n=1 Tax=Papilio machaon TaxID=76193 RepID=UPI001E663C2F|nr:uncharacterized protein LOC106713191 [Papilio machaon]
MRWNEAVTLEFVKIYLKHECLWNPSHPDYKIKYERDKAYADIASEFQLSTMKSLSIPEIKIKIKNLRTTYLQQVHKIIQSSTPDCIYEPSLIWFHEMDQYMKNIPTNRHSALYNTNQETSVADSSCQIWVDQDLPNDNTEESDTNPLNPSTDTEYDSTKPEISLHVKKETDYSSQSFNKVKKKKTKRQSSEQHNSTDSTSDSVALEDEFDIYGKYIASQLRNMDLQKALQLQLEINNLVSKTRISELSNDIIMRWDENETYPFVKLYLSKDSLWNPNHENHKLIDERKKAYQMIIDEFMSSTGIQLNEYGVKLKIKNLRSTYAQEINKIRTRSGPLSKYTPTIKWFADWHRCFQIVKKTDIDTVYDDHISESNKSWITNNVDQTNDDGNIDHFTSDFQSNSKCNITKLNGRVKNLSKKKRKKLKLISSNICDRLRDSDASFTREDEFDLYGRYIASQLRQMDIKKAVQLQLEIQSLMSEARITDLMNDI